MILDTLLQAGEIKRYHTHPTIGTQSVAEHTCRVLDVLWYLTNGELSKELIFLALFHDRHEIETGDIPAITKWAHPELGTWLDELEKCWIEEMGLDPGWVTDEEKKLLKQADMLELCLYARDQFLLGNRHARPLYLRGRAYLKDKELLTERGEQLIEQMNGVFSA